MNTIPTPLTDKLEAPASAFGPGAKVVSSIDVRELERDRARLIEVCQKICALKLAGHLVASKALSSLEAQ